MEAGGLDPKDPASLSALIQGAYKYWTGDPQAAERIGAEGSEAPLRLRLPILKRAIVSLLVRLADSATV